MKFKNIIFDFDGTLIDTKPGVVESFKKVAKGVNEENVISLLGRPLVEIISILLGTKDQEAINKSAGLFKRYYSSDGLCKSFIYPGIQELLEHLRAANANLFIVSNKIEPFINEILEKNNLKKYFTFIFGTDGSDKRSKKAENIRRIIGEYKLRREETAVVGDTENDIFAAKENFLYSIGVTWGYGLESNLIKAQVDKICRTPLELQKFISKE